MKRTKSIVKSFPTRKVYELSEVSHFYRDEAARELSRRRRRNIRKGHK